MDNADKTRQAIEALAELYLTGPEQGPRDTSGLAEGKAPDATDEPAPPDATDAAPPVEGVLIGHLPGFAAPWLTQYADHLAAERGPTALCHVDPDGLDIDLVEPNPHRRPNHPSPDEATGPTDRRLRHLLDELATRVRGWLIHLGDPVMPLTRRLAGTLDAWTVITGCDEAALVAAYQMLKQLIRPGRSASPPKRLQLMFMGCDVEQADHAAERVRRAGERFLDVPIVLLGARRQMQPVLKRRVASFSHSPDNPPHWQVLMDFIADLRSSIGDRTEAPMEPEPARPATRAPGPRRQAPHPTPQISSPTPRASPPDLAAFIDDLSACEARCPRHRAVQLAIDSARRPHVLVHAAGEAIRPAVADLLAVAAWARQNAQLLAVEPDPPPMLHLFVDQPKAVADLVATDAMRLHLLLPMIVADRVTWHHVDLN